MKSNINYRAASQADLNFLLQLHKQTMEPHLLKAGLGFNDDVHLECIREFFADSLIVMCDGRAIGLLKLGVLPGSLHIRQLQLLPQYQRQGIGSRVLTHIKNRAMKMQRPITLNVLRDNPARDLYRRAGFTITGQNDFEYAMCYEFNAVT